MSEDSSRSSLMEECIQNCMDCYRICLETFTYGIQKGGRYVEPNHLQVLTDCIETCRTSAHMMIKGSELHPQMCGVCAEACRRCAESCEAMADDEQMKKCAEMCRKCEQSCRQMASM